MIDYDYDVTKPSPEIPRACGNIRLVTWFTVVGASLVLWAFAIGALYGSWQLANTELAQAIMRALAAAVGAGP